MKFDIGEVKTLNLLNLEIWKFEDWQIWRWSLEVRKLKLGSWNFEVWIYFQVKLEGIPLNTPLYIAFRHYSNNRYIIALDNVNVVTNNLTNKEKLNSNSFSVYPNPSNGYINIESSVNDEIVNIYNTMGKTVWSGIIDHKVLIYLAKGIYFLENQEETFKIIIQ